MEKKKKKRKNIWVRLFCAEKSFSFHADAIYKISRS